MDYSLKSIKELPLAELWNDNGSVKSERVKDLAIDDIKKLLRGGKVEFVVANIGDTPRWIDPKDTFDFWKNEVQPRLAETNEVHLENYPEEYCYSAAQWSSEDDRIFVVLEMVH